MNEQHEHDVTQGFERLAARMQPSDTSVTADLSRSRSQARRRTALVSGVAGLAVAGVIGGAALLVPSGQADLPVAGAPSASDSTTALAPASASPSQAPTPSKQAEPQASQSSGFGRTGPDEWAMTAAFDRKVDDLTQAWRPAMLDALDPSGRHLDKKFSNLDDGLNEAGRFVTGTSVGWSTPGESGMGVVTVKADTAGRPGCTSYEKVACEKLSAPEGTRGAWRWTEFGTTFHRVLRADGSTVVVGTNRHFGNNSLTPVKSMDITQADILRLAADPRIRITDTMRTLYDEFAAAQDKVMKKAMGN